MKKVTRFLQQGISPVWAIVVIVVIATLIATAFLVYGYFWTPNEPQGQVEVREKIGYLKTYSRNGDTLTFNYFPKLWIVELDEAVIIGQNRKDDIIEPIFKINYKEGIDKNEAGKYIEGIYGECKIKSWKAKGEIYVPDFVTPCGRIFAAYSKNSSTLVVFDLNQMACIFDCETDYIFIGSIKVDGFALRNIYEY